MKVIGISGKMGCGKNYIAEKIIGQLLNDLGYNISFLAFADLLKYEIGSRIENINNIEEIQNKMDKNYYNLFVEKDSNTRNILQKYGTENGREAKNKKIEDITLYYDENIWIKGLYLMMKNIYEKVYNKQKHIFIITDVRFINEADFIKSLNGKIIRVNAINRNINRINQEVQKYLITHQDNKENIDINNIKNKLSSHKSETELDNYNFDFILNNDSDYINSDFDLIINNIITSIIY